ncbi:MULTISPECIES: 7-cyano-7-deazaguanine synthase QueC [Nitrosomonas]|uniref:7-cyano-7-deazaguanine synthase n=1 Tax=Nitrosomonas communis TaxID=44574 RepID=A0A0F7KAZ2_9PROT|nr:MULTISPECIES: 7-cyano-7-deazaguanine synthase QueC [Nitrosomonas]AKH36766.1 7-cyano-7-deazaguanine synthase [Nitrosomonas communis]TYP86679.1 7-cyano-7-deazaguanine synthase [Nitrosomonas communis]UVS61836.1 7-cyano-7-deazaguanine synthase QueC [Nitrosomonas sp. PLL12]
MRKAVVLLSGGLDSATTLAMACDKGFACYALSIDYGQRHQSELAAARKVGQSMGIKMHRTISIDLSALGGSALTDRSIAVPTGGTTTGIPVTYVPARNTVMLSLALAWAEVLGSHDIFIGVNAIDYSGYPDCRPDYIEAFEKMSNLATKTAREGNKLMLHAPLLNLSKKEIISLGKELGVDYALTVSCYQADESGSACGLCDACRIRRAGFLAADISDPTRYRVG